jgi:hypothetical protein
LSAEAEELRLGGNFVRVMAALGISIMVPTMYFISTPAAAMSLSAVEVTMSLTNFNS